MSTDQARTTTMNPRCHRTIASAATGRFAALRGVGALTVIDVLGTAPRAQVPFEGRDFGFVGEHVWLVDDEGLRCFAPGGIRIAATAAVDAFELVPGYGRGACTAALRCTDGWRLATHRGAHIE